MPPQGKTLWEMLKTKLAGPVEGQVYNPCHAKIGSAVTINDLGLADANFFVKQIRQYRRTIEGREFLICRLCPPGPRAQRGGNVGPPTAQSGRRSRPRRGDDA